MKFCSLKTCGLATTVNFPYQVVLLIDAALPNIAAQNFLIEMMICFRNQRDEQASAITILERKLTLVERN